MFFFYIDESGTNLSNKKSRYFVLAAIVIDSNDCGLIDKEVKALKRQLFSWAKPEDFEIKGREIRRGENIFSSLQWAERIAFIQVIADTIKNLPCDIFAIQVDKQHLPSGINSEEQVYRLALFRLLEQIEADLQSKKESGLLMFDSRSDLRNSVQDRRLLDAYLDWVASQPNPVHIIDLPWFGFSNFYSGLQLADFCAYMIDYNANEFLASKTKTLAENLIELASVDAKQLEEALPKVEPKLKSQLEASTNQLSRERNKELQDVYRTIESKIKLLSIP